MEAHNKYFLVLFHILYPSMKKRLLQSSKLHNLILTFQFKVLPVLTMITLLVASFLSVM